MNPRGRFGVIALEKVSFGYDGRPILDEVSIDVPAGTFLFLTGPSGSGKTTLLRLLNAELRPTAGALRLFGTEVQDRDGAATLRRRIGFVHQEPRFIDHMGLRENLSLPHIVDGETSAAGASEVESLMAWVGLAARAGSKPPTLSGGEKQRAALARALVRAPEMILADEPTGNVDWEMSLKILDLLAELNRGGVTVVVATHDLPLIREAKSLVSARVARLAGGRLTMAGADL